MSLSRSTTRWASIALALAAVVAAILLTRSPDAGPPPPGAGEATHAPAQPAESASSPDEEAATPAPAWHFPSAARIVAIGDLHGDLEATKQVLRLTGLVDDGLRWSGGEAVLVQTGDQLDRGDGERAIVDLLERLQGEALAAGGRIIVLNGNHELMNVAGDLRYVTPGGFVDFADFGPAPAGDPIATAVAPPQQGRVIAFRPGGPYAEKLARRPVIAQVGETVFVHGGVLPLHVELGVERINREVAAWVAGRGPNPSYMRRRDSPVWSRHYSDSPDAADCALLADTLGRLGAKRMIVGHTVQKGGPSSACDGRVWRIDVGLAAHYGGRPAGIEIRGDRVQVLGLPQK